MIIDVGMLWGQITELRTPDSADTTAHVMSDHIRMSHTNHWPQPGAEQPEYVARNIFTVGPRRRLDMQLIYVRCYYPYFTLPDTTTRHRSSSIQHCSHGVHVIIQLLLRA